MSSSLGAADVQDNLLEPGPADILHREIRREGKVVAVLRAAKTGVGVDVRTRVFPLNSTPAGPNAVDRTFSFSSADHAHAFADETIVAFEYLGCSVS